MERIIPILDEVLAQTTIRQLNVRLFQARKDCMWDGFALGKTLWLSDRICSTYIGALKALILHELQHMKHHDSETIVKTYLRPLVSSLLLSPALYLGTSSHLLPLGTFVGTLLMTYVYDSYYLRPLIESRTERESIEKIRCKDCLQEYCDAAESRCEPYGQQHQSMGYLCKEDIKERIQEIVSFKQCRQHRELTQQYEALNSISNDYNDLIKDMKNLLEKYQ